MSQGIQDIETRYKANGIEDYVSLLLYAEDAQVARHQQSIASVLQAFKQTTEPRDTPAIEYQLPKYKYCLYVASQLLTEAKYWELLQRDDEAYQTAKEEAEGMEGDELLQYLHDSISEMGPEVLRGYFEIGYAAKLRSRLLEDEGWQIWGLLRYGTFERNSLLTDSTIVEELCGSEGHTGQSFSRDLVVSNKAQIKGAREGVVRCLEHNPLWREAILLALDEIEADYPDAAVEIRISNPSMGLLTIYHSLTKEEGFRYLPGYRVSVIQGDRPILAYAGCLIGEREPASLTEILNEFYDGSIGGVMLSFSWGGYTAKDVEILNGCGITYSSLKRDLRKDPLQLYRLNGKNWEPTSPPNPSVAFLSHMGKPSEFLEELIGEISSRDHGGFYEF